MLYTKSELKDMQANDVWPIHEHDNLKTKFADRWQQSETLMSQVDEEFFNTFNSSFTDDPSRSEKWEDEDIPEKSYAYKYGGPVFSCDMDYMIGPHDWHNDSDDVQKENDYVMRKKLYLYNWSRDRYYAQSKRCPQLEYFMDMHDAFVPVLEHYANETFSEYNDRVRFYLYKLMVIEYSTPTANEDNFIKHREHNTLRFGPEHCDETIGGLHMGENYNELEAQHPTSKQWTGVPELTEPKSLWMFGEHSERTGWTPTYHRMTHNPDPYIEGKRYSIIFDLQARFNGED